MTESKTLKPAAGWTLTYSRYSYRVAGGDVDEELGNSDSALLREYSMSVVQQLRKLNRACGDLVRNDEMSRW